MYKKREWWCNDDGEDADDDGGGGGGGDNDDGDDDMLNCLSFIAYCKLFCISPRWEPEFYVQRFEWQDRFSISDF